MPLSNVELEIRFEAAEAVIEKTGIAEAITVQAASIAAQRLKVFFLIIFIPSLNCGNLKATPHKARLTAWQRIYLHIFRHLARKLLAGR